MKNEKITESVLEIMTDYLYPEEKENYSIPYDLLPETLHSEFIILSQSIHLYETSFNYEEVYYLSREELNKSLLKRIKKLTPKAKEKIKKEPENYITACFLQKESSK